MKMTIVHGGAPVLYQSCRLLVIKLLLLVAAFGAVQVAFAQTVVANDYRLNPVQGCFIKAIQNRSYVDVPLEKFSEVKIHAVAHPNRPKYFAFKNLGVIHLIPKKCLTSWSSYSDIDDLPEIPETDEFKKYERTTKRSREDRILNKIEVSQMNYFIEVAGGIGFISDGKGGFDSKAIDGLGDYIEDTLVDPARFLDSKSKAKSNPLSISLRIGLKSSIDSFWTFGFKSYQFNRQDDYRYEMDNGTYEVIYDLEFDESFKQFSIGHVWFFDAKSNVRPFFDISFFVSLIEQTITDTGLLSVASLKTKMNGTGLGASAGAGVEFLVSRNVSMRLSGNYGQTFYSKFRFKSTTDPLLEEFDYTGQFRYPHLSANLGFTLYFQ